MVLYEINSIKLSPMKTIIKLIPFYIVLLFASCDRDLSAGAAIKYCNNSSHHILMTDFDSYAPEEHAAGIEIFPGETIHYDSSSHMTSGDGKYDADHREIIYDAKYLLPRNVTIVFDGQYAIKYSQDDTNNKLCILENYIPKRSGDRFWYFVYTFTDEDYAYAREHGEVVE